MLFNSFVFLVFFAVVYGAYLLLMKRLRLQNILLLAASYIFYGWWDWRFLTLLFISTAVDFWVGLKMSETSEESRRRKFLVFSVVFQLCILGGFKYFNFFADQFVFILDVLGLSVDYVTLRVVLPGGISV